MKFVRIDEIKNPFVWKSGSTEVQKNKYGLLFIEHSYSKLEKSGHSVAPVFETLDEFKGFIEIYRKEIIKKATPLKKDFYFLKMRKYDAVDLYYDFGLNLFASAQVANECKEYLLKNSNVFKDADLRVTDKDDNEITFESNLDSEQEKE